MGKGLIDRGARAGTVSAPQYVDLTAETRFARELAVRATHDPLTGLANRALLLERIDRALAHRLMRGEPAAVLFCDLDHFKLINDTYGHAVGDSVMCATAERLVSLCREGETVARLGGDEFAVLVTGPSAERARALGHLFVEAMREPIDLGFRFVRLSMSVGIGLAREGHTRAPDLLREADAALYDAKQRGRDRVEQFSVADAERMRRRAQIDRDLRRALECDELRLRYQPLIDLTTGEAVGVEALVRWQHPEQGLLAPAEFIGVAEESGLIEAIDRFAIQESCRQLARWSQRRAAPHLVCVNVSGRDFSNPEMAPMVADTIESSSIDPSSLCIEITESTMLETGDGAVDALRRLRAKGVYLALDDFGTGYASLSTLRYLPVEVIKVDRTFVDGIANDPHDGAVVAAVMSLAHALGMHVIAEGVERPEQVCALLELGCTTAQGFLFAKPLPPSEIDDVWRAPAADRLDLYRRQSRVSTHRSERLFIDEFMHQMGITVGGVL